VWLAVRLSPNQKNHEGKLAMHYLILAGVLSMMALCTLIIGGLTLVRASTASGWFV
jgi:hypothetical protein